MHVGLNKVLPEYSLEESKQSLILGFYQVSVIAITPQVSVIPLFCLDLVTIFKHQPSPGDVI